MWSAQQRRAFTHGMSARFDGAQTELALIVCPQSRKAIELRIERTLGLIERMTIATICVGLPELNDQTGNRAGERVEEAPGKGDRLPLGTVRKQGRGDGKVLAHLLDEHTGIKRANG